MEQTKGVEVGRLKILYYARLASYKILHFTTRSGNLCHMASSLRANIMPAFFTYPMMVLIEMKDFNSTVFTGTAACFY